MKHFRILIVFSLLVAVVPLPSTVSSVAVPAPNPPGSFTATPISRFQINLGWTKGSYADGTYVEAKLGSYPSTRTDGTTLYNGSGVSVNHNGLTPSQHWYYSAWSWNLTYKVWSRTTAAVNTTTLTDTPPTYGTPSPTNGSTNQPLSLTWSIPINDPEGDTFDWTIHASNGQTNTGTTDHNGTKTLTLSGLTYSTPYTIWVNTTDQYTASTHKWYQLTTRSSYTPTSPAPFTATPVSRTEIDLSWTKDSSADTTYIQAKLTSAPTSRTDGTNIYNGTGTSKTHTGLNPGEHWYYSAWSWNTTDKQWSTTAASAEATTVSNTPPTYGTPSPINGSTNQPLSLTWSIPISDPDGDTFTWTIHCSNGQAASQPNDHNGTKTLTLTGLTYSTSYLIWVNATDQYGASTSYWYHFLTRSQYIPSPPSSFTTTSVSRFEIQVSWSKGDMADATYVEAKLNSYPSNRTDGTTLYNGSGTSISHTGLNPNQQWYYRAWSWNKTDQRWSPPAAANTTTFPNVAPSYGTPSPTNGTTEQPLSLTWSIQISDPNGDTFNWTIHCNNSQYTQGNNAANGPKTLTINGLAYDVTYTIWVNATDALGASTHAAYHFTTYPTPLPPSTFTAKPDTRTEINLTWMKGSNADYTSITAKYGSNPSNMTDGETIYNGTGTSAAHTSLNPAEPWYYRAWSWNTTNHLWSTSISANASTLANHAPTLGSPSPSKDSTGQPLSLTWTIPINDPDNDTINWTIHANNGQTHSGTNDHNGTKIFTLTNLTYSTPYIIWVNATDQYGASTHTWYQLTTRSPDTPTPPSPFTATLANRTEINLTWTKGNDADITYIQAKLTSAPTSRTDGTNIYNGTGTTKTCTNLSPGEHWYYSAWSWNTTDKQWSTTAASANATILFNNPPSYGRPSPINGSTNQPLSLTWTIPISDPERDSFDWTIQSSNGQKNNGSGAANGTKILTLSGLTYATTYKIWVNATDPTGSEQYTRQWFIFRTKASTGTSSKVENTTDTMVNLPPTPPRIIGPTIGSKNTSYTFDIVAYDPESDAIQYYVDWGDGIITTSVTLSSGTSYVLAHTWTASTVYSIHVYAEDTQHHSSSIVTVTMAINAISVKDYGYLIAETSDGIAHSFYSNSTGQITNIEPMANGSYLLDLNGDGQLDHIYNPLTHTMAAYYSHSPAIPPVVNSSINWLFLLISGCVVILCMGLISWKKKK